MNGLETSHIFLVLFVAWLWLEVTLRFIALIESSVEERVGFLQYVVITVLWPLMLVMSVVRHILVLPRRWDPDAPKIDPDDD